MGMIARREAEAAKEAEKPVVAIDAQAVETKLSGHFSGRVLDKEALKTRQIQRQGCWQAAAHNPALVGYAADLDALKIVIRELAEDGIKFINE